MKKTFLISTTPQLPHLEANNITPLSILAMLAEPHQKLHHPM